MTSRKGKRKTAPENDFSFRLETGATLESSPAIRIGLRFEKGSAQTSSLERRDEVVPQERG